MVYLVGAGPGDPGLVTVKGLELIKKADCIIYDRLSSPELLGYAGMDCERIYVGKADRHHTLPQEQINELPAVKSIRRKELWVARAAESEENASSFSAGSFRDSKKQASPINIIIRFGIFRSLRISLTLSFRCVHHSIAKRMNPAR